MGGLKIVPARPSKNERSRAERESVERSLLMRQGYGAFHAVAVALLAVRDAMTAEIERHERAGKRGAHYCLWCAEDGHGTPTDWPCPTVEELEPALAAIHRILPAPPVPDCEVEPKGSND